MKAIPSRKFGKACVFLAAGLCMGTFPAYAQTTREVNQNDPGAPHQTIGAAVAASLPGDTVLVHPGTYVECVTISGITLRALRGPEVTVIQGTNGGGTGVFLTGNQDVSLVGFRVQGFLWGIIVNTSGGDTKVANCVAAGCAAAGFGFGASMPLQARIQNNISAHNGTDGFADLRPPDNYAYTFTACFNNIAAGNHGYGFQTTAEYNYATFGGYNCAYGNAMGQFGYRDGGGPGSIIADPLLDVTRHYRFVTQGSSAVNTGHPHTYYNDPDNSRNDMGAYGGRDAANWWRDPTGGPSVQNVTVDPPQVAPGGIVTIRATAVAQ